MLKILIIDDEPIVREGLKSIIDWESHGFSVCGEGVDGRDGLNKIIALTPDLILIDIKMPGLQGIDVIKEAQESGYKGKVIILTGYSDFSYAQNAIRLSVKSYLLKPIDEDELIGIVDKMRMEIENEKRMQKVIDESIKLSRSSIIRNIITGESTKETLQNDIETYGLDFKFDSYQVALMDTRPDEEMGDSRITTGRYIEDFATDIVGLEFFTTDERLGILFKGKSISEAVKLLKDLNRSLFNEVGVQVLISLGRTVQSIDNAPQSYKDAKNLLERKFIYEDLGVVSWEDINKEPAAGSIDSIGTELLFTSIEIGDLDKLNDIIIEAENIFRQSNLSAEKIKGLCVNYFIELKEKIVSNYPEHKDIMPSNEVIIQGIYDQNSLHALLEYIKEEFTGISRVIGNASSDNTMKKLLNYIQKNYYKDLKLELLAEIFNYNSSYLGKMFKNFTGESFNSYLDKVRIENAKLLLQGDLRVYQVSEKVGYKNIDYFYSKFKKYVGISPKEFKKQ